MMEKIDIFCPRCGLGCQLALEEGTDIVVMKCPDCATHLVHYHGQTFAIDESEWRYLRVQGHVREAEGWMRAAPNPAAPSAATPPPPPAPEAQGIDDAALADLRSELEKCQSVDDFLRMLDS